MTSSRKSIERDARVMHLYEQLLEVEQRLIPTGLHTFGRAAELTEKADLLSMIASYDRPEHDVHALPKLVADALGIQNYDSLVQETTTSEIKQRVDGLVREGVQQFLEQGPEAAAGWLKTSVGVDTDKSLPTFSFLASINEQLDSNHEIESLVR